MSAISIVTTERMMVEQGQSIIDLCLERGQYRPTVACLVTNGLRAVLVKSAKADRGGWKLPQGGIDPNELLLEAAEREMHEELEYDIFRNKLDQPWVDSIYTKPYKPGREARENYPKGKLIVNLAIWQSGALSVDNFNPEVAEVSDMALVPPRSVGFYANQEPTEPERLLRKQELKLQLTSLPASVD